MLSSVKIVIRYLKLKKSIYFILSSILFSLPFFPAFVAIIGGPSGSGKTSLARKMANIVGCEVVSLESYYKSEHVKDFKYDDFSSLDLSLLSKVQHHPFFSSAL